MVHTLRISVRNWRIRVLYNLEDKAQQIVGFECMLQRAHFVQDAAQRPKVRLVAVRFVLTDFWAYNLSEMRGNGGGAE